PVAAPAEVAEAPPTEAPEATEAPAPETAEAPVLSRASAACAGEPTPADRTICDDPELQRLQRELRDAYAEALDAHEDRDLLRQRQLAWRDARNTVTDPARLARLYEDRIRKLNSATAAARGER
ncbi:MAG: DUF1311 domain-containing protein, partial [Alphaproteobacteria bacterium]|nr:DUF1311 domain-containing protein [Alphaproteobacteria bacterium]